MSFSYDPSWIASDAAFPISISLPVRSDEYVGGAAHNYFANLLPEGAVRDAVASRLGISPDNDLALLRAIGGECAGALSIVEPGAPAPDPDAFRYEALDERRLQSLVSKPDIVPLLVGGAATRLSLAGAQDKVPVAMIDGRLSLPLGGAPSTHILKLPHHRYAHIPVNEAFVTGLAAKIGFDVVSASLFTRTDPPSLLVERYDRRASDDPWPAIRIHQEDLCQALGLSSSTKYEIEGGPTFVRAIDVVRAHVQRPLVDVPRLIEWQAFNIVAGNSDGHGKNISLRYEGRLARLVPFYDLLSTREYEGLDRMLAMGVGDRRDPDQVHRAQWEALARELRIGARLVIQLVDGVATRCLEVIEDWTQEFRELHGESPILQTLPRAIGKRARKVLAHSKRA